MIPGFISYFSLYITRFTKGSMMTFMTAVAGFKDGESYLGTVDSIATSYTDDHIATGYGEYLARPLMRSRFNPNMSEGDARALLEDWWVPAIRFALLPALC